MLKRLIFGTILAFALSGTAFAQSTTNVTTYHNDNLRTGWNSTETLLKPASVSPTTFGLIAKVTLDEQVDAQPLVFKNIVYVVTENNSVYAIDPNAGKILKTVNLGAPVPMSVLPGKCSSNSASIGITSTPVIDAAHSIMYLVSYTLQANHPVYRVHKLALPSLAEITNIVVTASQGLKDGTTFTFNAAVQRQRAALLEANGNIYAAFGSFCDLSANVSRGWLLGWNAATLTPLKANGPTASHSLVDQQTSMETPTTGHLHNFYLSSIWMSGAGVASDSSGDLYFATGNSDGTRPDNFPESVVRISSDLTMIRDYFTPYQFATWETEDLDLGSGGVLLLPDQPGSIPHLATANGKGTAIYVINRDNMGKFNAGGDKETRSLSTGDRCWCAFSYYKGSDGVGRVIGSGGETPGNFIRTYPVTSTGFLSREAAFNLGKFVQDAGFFTSVSSNGTTANTQIIWAVARPTSATLKTLTLYAMNGTPTTTGNLKTFAPPLYSGPAGTWQHLNGNANVVPTVANGRVFVASYQNLAIFGLIH